jgi:hypothetical protein
LATGGEENPLQYGVSHDIHSQAIDLHGDDALRFPTSAPRTIHINWPRGPPARSARLAATCATPDPELRAISSAPSHKACLK